jgi:hypothetical protein
MVDETQRETLRAADQKTGTGVAGFARPPSWDEMVSLGHFGVELAGR